MGAALSVGGAASVGAALSVGGAAPVGAAGSAGFAGGASLLSELEAVDDGIMMQAATAQDTGGNDTHL